MSNEIKIQQHNLDIPDAYIEALELFFYGARIELKSIRMHAGGYELTFVEAMP